MRSLSQNLDAALWSRLPYPGSFIYKGALNAIENPERQLFRARDFVQRFFGFIAIIMLADALTNNNDPAQLLDWIGKFRTLDGRRDLIRSAWANVKDSRPMLTDVASLLSAKSEVDRIINSTIFPSDVYRSDEATADALREIEESIRVLYSVTSFLRYYLLARLVESRRQSDDQYECEWQCYRGSQDSPSTISVMMGGALLRVGHIYLLSQRADWALDLSPFMVAFTGGDEAPPALKQITTIRLFQGHVFGSYFPKSDSDTSFVQRLVGIERRLPSSQTAPPDSPPDSASGYDGFPRRCSLSLTTAEHRRLFEWVQVRSRLPARYERVTSLGAGAYGEVFEALDNITQRSVAVKILHAHLLKHPDVRRRFEREAKLLKELEHRCIVKVYDYDLGDNSQLPPFIVMDLVNGSTLTAWLKERSITRDEALRILIDVLDALAYAHGRNVIHRDIAPNNILIAQDGTPYLIDFGTARLLEGTSLTSGPMETGTPRFRSPEQERGETADEKSDIFSVGKVGLHVLAEIGKAPNGRTRPRGKALSQLQLICEKASKDNPDERFSSAREMLNELRKISVLGTPVDSDPPQNGPQPAPVQATGVPPSADQVSELERDVRPPINIRTLVPALAGGAAPETAATRPMDDSPSIENAELPSLDDIRTRVAVLAELPAPGRRGAPYIDEPEKLTELFEQLRLGPPPDSLHLDVARVWAQFEKEWASVNTLQKLERALTDLTGPASRSEQDAERLAGESEALRRRLDVVTSLEELFKELMPIVNSGPPSRGP